MSSSSPSASESPHERGTRQRILKAAFTEFARHGYADTTTLQIAKRAQVSKRELYTLVGNKQQLLTACIAERGQRLKVPELPPPADCASLQQTLEQLGLQLLKEISAPTVIAVFRLAIAEAERAPEVARTLDQLGRQVIRGTLQQVLRAAQSAQLLSGDPDEMTEHFSALLWGDLMLDLLLRTANPPSAAMLLLRAQKAAMTLLELYAAPTPLKPARSR